VCNIHIIILLFETRNTRILSILEHFFVVCNTTDDFLTFDFFRSTYISENFLSLEIMADTKLVWFSISAELGDYHPDEHKPGYLSGLSLVPGQTEEMELKIEELHKLHKWVLFCHQFFLCFFFFLVFSRVQTGSAFFVSLSISP
jgi:hypothetical protein